MEDQQVPEGFVPDVKPDGFVPDTPARTPAKRGGRRRSVIITRVTGTNPGPHEITDEQPVAGPKPVSGNPQEEPGNYMGGFIKGLKQYGSDLMDSGKPALQSAAQPKSTGDMLNLLIPNLGPGVLRGFKDMKDRMDMAVKDSSRLRDIPGALIRNSKEAVATNGFPNLEFKRTPLAEQMNQLPSTGTVERTRTGIGAQPPVAQETIKDLPLWKQQELMEKAGTADVPLAGGRAQTPPHVPTAPVQDVSSLPKPPTGKAPTVEDSITQALQEIMQAKEKPTIMSGAPPVETAGEGPFKQSGKFGKSGNLGQAGGYSSGMPPPQTAPVVSTPTPGPGGSPQGPPPDVAPPTSSPLSEMRGTAEPTLPGEADVIKPPTLDSAVADIFKPSNSRMDELLAKFGGKSTEGNLLKGVAQELRDKHGSRDAARMMFGSSSQENVDKLLELAPGPSKIPTEAEDRMRQSMEHGYDWGGKDDTIKGD